MTDIKSLYKLKKDMDDKITQFIQSEINTFNNITDLEVSSIELEFGEITTIKDLRQRFILINAVSKVEL
jgi:hypothetical protein